MPLEKLTIASSSSLQKKLEKYEQIIKGVTRAVAIEYSIAPSQESTLTGHENNWHATVFVEHS